MLNNCWQTFDAAGENSNGLLKEFKGCHKVNFVAMTIDLPSCSELLHLVFFYFLQKKFS